MAATATILDLSADDYHADNIDDRPSLSRTIAHILCDDTPAHAKAAHPKLNPHYKREDKDEFDIGTVVHDLLLYGASNVELVDADNYRTKAAQEAKAAARAAGRQPLLPHQWEAAEEMVEAVREQLLTFDADPPLFGDGDPEPTIVWEENGVVCRARPDWLHAGYGTIDDFKTARTANPDKFTGRSLYDYGYDIQAEFYSRGVEAVTGMRPDFRFVVVEKEPPYMVSVCGLGPAALTLAKKKVDYAIDLWRRCLATDRWPGYPTQVCYAELPSYQEERWLSKELREAA